MKYFPLFLDINERHCIVIGGGPVASRKVTSLLKSNAKVTLISPMINADIQALVDAKKISFLEREYQDEDISNAFLVVAATNDSKVNTCIASQANTSNTLVNVADNPELGSFIFPSVVDRDPVTVAISTW